jgi:hypothetical protein
MSVGPLVCRSFKIAHNAAAQRSSKKNMVLGKFIFLKVQDFFRSPIAAKRMMDAVRVF